MKLRVFSGIQPSGVPHLGNYIGALQQWLTLQDTHDALFCIVDYHAITVRQDPDDLNQTIYSLAALYLAVGLDPNKVVLFRQSDVSAHTELAWILGSIIYLGELERMIQYKDKAKQHKKNNNAGLFIYPILMAADILLYQTQLVPVGEDQKQHIELTRNLAERFNQQYGETFVVPDIMQPKQGARIMSLDDPSKKMSKSATSAWGYISLLDTPDVIRKKIKKAVTDSGTEVTASNTKPALTNLLTIFSVLGGQSLIQLETLYRGRSYSQFKQELAETIITELAPIQKRYQTLMEDTRELQRILQQGKHKAETIAQRTLAEVKSKIGL